MPDRRPKTQTRKVQFNYLFDRMKQLEWDIHHPIAVDWAIPREWHEIAARTRKSEKMRITLRVEKDVVRFFKSLGAGYQVKMDDVLASFMHAKLAGILREEGEIDTYFNDSETQPRTHIGAMDEMLAELRQMERDLK